MPAQQSGRGPNGRVRNFRAMKADKLSRVLGQLIFEANDRAAFAAALDAGAANFGWYNSEPGVDTEARLSMWQQFEAHAARMSPSVSTKGPLDDMLRQLAGMA